MCVPMYVRELIETTVCSNDDKRQRLMNASVAEIYDILPAEILQNVKSLCV